MPFTWNDAVHHDVLGLVHKGSSVSGSLPNRLEWWPKLSRRPLHQQNCFHLQVNNNITKVIVYLTEFWVQNLLEFTLIWLVSEFLRLWVDCNEFKDLASLSMSLLAASNFARRSFSEIGRLLQLLSVAGRLNSMMFCIIFMSEW